MANYFSYYYILVIVLMMVTIFVVDTQGKSDKIMPGKYRSEENPTPKSPTHSGDKVAKPGSQPDRAPVENSKTPKKVQQQGRAVPSASKRMIPNPVGHH